jgi:hypothetical protein
MGFSQAGAEKGAPGIVSPRHTAVDPEGQRWYPDETDFLENCEDIYGF